MRSEMDPRCSKLAGHVLRDRLGDRLGLIEVEAVEADLEYRASLPDHQAAARSVLPGEVDIERLVSNTADRLCRHARELSGLAGVELVYRTATAARLVDGERDAFSLLTDPLTRRWHDDRRPGADGSTNRGADLSWREQWTGYGRVRCG